jgi:hypothetical protein
MADTNATRPKSAQTAPPRGQRGDNARGGTSGRRGRGVRTNNDTERAMDNNQNEGRAPRRGRGGNRGAGARGNSTLTPADLATRFAQKAPEPEIPAVSASKAPEAKDGEEEDVDAEVCFICASPVVHNAVAPCNHRTCHICALRMRALYKTKDCAHCRVSIPCQSLGVQLLTLETFRRRLHMSSSPMMPQNDSKSMPSGISRVRITISASNTRRKK